MGILSISRRCDIPAFNSEWFYRSYERGYAIVHERGQLKQVSLKPEDVDCAVFWTKDFAPMMSKVQSIEFPFYVQWTVNSYGKDVEPAVRMKNDIVRDVVTLSNIIGKERIVWRYDPIFMSEKYNLLYHIEMFSRLCQRLAGHVRHCVISFVDMYGFICSRMATIGARVPTKDEIDVISATFSSVAADYGIEIVTCSEVVDLSKYNIKHGHCIDVDICSELAGRNLLAGKDPTQRKACGCCVSQDIGAYNTCKHGCLYCYATK